MARKEEKIRTPRPAPERSEVFRDETHIIMLDQCEKIYALELWALPTSAASGSELVGQLVLELQNDNWARVRTVFIKIGHRRLGYGFQLYNKALMSLKSPALGIQSDIAESSNKIQMRKIYAKLNNYTTDGITYVPLTAVTP